MVFEVCIITKISLFLVHARWATVGIQFVMSFFPTKMVHQNKQKLVYSNVMMILFMLWGNLK